MRPVTAILKCRLSVVRRGSKTKNQAYTWSKTKTEERLAKIQNQRLSDAKAETNPSDLP